MKVIFINEARNNEIGYHFTDIKSLNSILNDNSSKGLMKATNPPHELTNNKKSWSYTRQVKGNYFFNLKSFPVRLVIDIEKVSYRQKIVPFVYGEYFKGANLKTIDLFGYADDDKFEYEERVIGDTKNFNSCIKEITFKRNLKLPKEVNLRFTDNILDDLDITCNFHLGDKEQSVIKNIFREYKNALYEIKSQPKEKFNGVKDYLSKMKNYKEGNFQKFLVSVGLLSNNNRDKSKFDCDKAKEFIDNLSSTNLNTEKYYHQINNLIDPDKDEDLNMFDIIAQLVLGNDTLKETTKHIKITYNGGESEFNIKAYKRLIKNTLDRIIEHTKEKCYEMISIIKQNQDLEKTKMSPKEALNISKKLTKDWYTNKVQELSNNIKTKKLYIAIHKGKVVFIPTDKPEDFDIINNVDNIPNEDFVDDFNIKSNYITKANFISSLLNTPEDSTMLEFSILLDGEIYKYEILTHMIGNLTYLDIISKHPYA